MKIRDIEKEEYVGIISSDELSDSSTAATYLNDTYRSYYWWRY